MTFVTYSPFDSFVVAYLLRLDIIVRLQLWKNNIVY